MISSVKAYARARLRALGYVEHKDAFNSENIPRGALSDAFFAELGTVTGLKDNQDCQELLVPLIVKIFKAPQKDTIGNYDAAVDAADEVIAAFLAAPSRLTYTGLHTVYFNSMVIEPLADSNDNGCIVNFSFTMLVIISTR